MLKGALCFLTTLLIASSLNAQIRIIDAQGEHLFEKPPTKVVALNWAMAEQLIELDAPLLAVSDVAGYQEWVVQPALPEGIQDLGARAEPNLEKMARLQPDLIIVSGITKEQVARLKNIAPVLNFNTFNSDHNNPQVAIDTFRQLALLFNKSQLAEQKLSAMQQRFTELRSALTTAYQGKLPKVSTVRFANTASVYIYGDNSMSQYALKQLGIKPALDIATTQWGLVQKRVLELSKIQTGSVLYFEPFNEYPQLQASRLWQAMPIVRNNKVAAVPATWTYGGAMSLKYLAEAMATSLLTLAPNATEQNPVKNASNEAVQ
ncbi:MAG: iron-siderophore ABC transporter substrate-binding protein [Oceanospirillaceae bacterium]|nr:iron-siderophore ABC transporter substrate-binding protein [Oceanospirillaceae bacterium]